MSAAVWAGLGPWEPREALDVLPGMFLRLDGFRQVVRVDPVLAGRGSKRRVVEVGVRYAPGTQDRPDRVLACDALVQVRCPVA